MKRGTWDRKTQIDNNWISWIILWWSKTLSNFDFIIDAIVTCCLAITNIAIAFEKDVQEPNGEKWENNSVDNQTTDDDVEFWKNYYMPLVAKNQFTVIRNLLTMRHLANCFTNCMTKFAFVIQSGSGEDDEGNISNELEKLKWLVFSYADII